MIASHRHADAIDKQLLGARNIFYRILKGLHNLMNISLPGYVYHYTTPEKFRAIVSSDTVRLYTVHNFDDTMERKWRFRVESRVNGTFTDKLTGSTDDLALIIREELSNDHVFIQSNCLDADNPYLWKHYAQHGAGVCLRLSTANFIRHLNTNLPDFEHLPDYFKCCYVMYDTIAVEHLLDRVVNVLLRSELNAGRGELIVWFFYLEYFRNLVKSRNPYEAEREIRFMVSDNFSLFLGICSITARWGLFSCADKEGLSERFHEEFQKRKLIVRQSLCYQSDKKQSFVSVPLHAILDGVILGHSCIIKKEDISNLSMGAIRKSQITRSG